MEYAHVFKGAPLGNKNAAGKRKAKVHPEPQKAPKGTKKPKSAAKSDFEMVLGL